MNKKKAKKIIEKVYEVASLLDILKAIKIVKPKLLKLL